MRSSRCPVPNGEAHESPFFPGSVTGVPAVAEPFCFFAERFIGPLNLGSSC